MKKRKEPEPHPHYDLMCRLNDLRSIIGGQRTMIDAQSALIDKLDAELVGCLKTLRAKEQ